MTARALAIARRRNPGRTTTMCVYRGAYTCGTVGCASILDRHGRCPDGHRSEPIWSNDAEEIELDVEGDDWSPGFRGSIWEPPESRGYGAVLLTLDGKDFPTTDDESERALEILNDEVEQGDR